MTDIVERLRAHEVRHTQVSEPREPYETVAHIRPAEACKLEAAAEIERLRVVLKDLDARFRECSNIQASAEEAYDSYYRDMVAEILMPNA